MVQLGQERVSSPIYKTKKPAIVPSTFFTRLLELPLRLQAQSFTRSSGTAKLNSGGSKSDYNFKAQIQVRVRNTLIYFSKSTARYLLVNTGGNAFTFT
jgi:hypothetical protein